VRRSTIGMPEDGSFILERFVENNTAVFFCRVNKHDEKHEMLLEVYKPKQLFSKGRPTLETDAFKGAYPSQVWVTPRKLSGATGANGLSQTAALSASGFEALPSRLKEKIRDEGKAEFPVVLTKKEADQLTDALVRDAQTQKNGASVTK
jgi:hypothetical protein